MLSLFHPLLNFKMGTAVSLFNKLVLSFAFAFAVVVVIVVIIANSSVLKNVELPADLVVDYSLASSAEAGTDELAAVS